MLCLPTWMERCFQWNSLLQIKLSELSLHREHLERHSFATLEVVSGHPFHCCPSGIIIPNALVIWARVLTSIVFTKTELCISVYWNSLFCFGPGHHSEQRKWYTYFQNVLTNASQALHVGRALAHMCLWPSSMQTDGCFISWLVCFIWTV